MDKIFKFKTNSNVRVFTYTNTHDRLDFFIPLQWWRRLWCRNIKEKIQIVPKIKALIKLASVIAPTNSQSTNFIPQALKQRSASTVSIAHSQHRQPEHDQTNDSSSQQSRQAISLSLSPHSFGLYTPHDTITSKRIAISHELSWHCMFGAGHSPGYPHHIKYVLVAINNNCIRNIYTIHSYKLPPKKMSHPVCVRCLAAWRSARASDVTITLNYAACNIEIGQTICVVYCLSCASRRRRFNALHSLTR